jgi:hypothetical protein
MDTEPAAKNKGLQKSKIKAVQLIRTARLFSHGVILHLLVCYCTSAAIQFFAELIGIRSRGVIVNGHRFTAAADAHRNNPRNGIQTALDFFAVSFIFRMFQLKIDTCLRQEITSPLSMHGEECFYQKFIAILLSPDWQHFEFLIE